MKLKAKERWMLTLSAVVLIILAWCSVSIYMESSHKKRLEGLFSNTEHIVIHYSNHSKAQQAELQTLAAKTNNLFLQVDRSQNLPLHLEISRKNTRTTLPRKVVQKKYEFKLVEHLDKYKDLCSESPHFLVFVHSHPANQGRRDMIRETWASQAFTLGGVVIFIMGTESKHRLVIKKEVQDYGDILQYDFTDNYRNLVYKSIMSLKFTSILNCLSVKYVVKTDDDVILNLKRIEDILKSFQNQTRILLGSQASNNLVQRAGKWRVPVDLYPHTQFPVHLSGAAYVISIDTVCKLAELSETVPAIPIEDVYITGILAERAGIQLIPRQDFPSWLKRGPRAECDYIRGRTVGLHGCLPREMQELWNKLSSGTSC